ncbi:hypothetical protein BT63DRAFT_78773 [Microthyrium microscopicum]|uniref:Uncharacterized protein n=1 Tax=Microthyrium microscopicum TaxID=703497 RepID=A0A6A6TYI7_9PEZI|nr:hypothetical protein BT63DRAFT_78773 [Microthyrium microscopicum]
MPWPDAFVVADGYLEAQIEYRASIIRCDTMSVMGAFTPCLYMTLTGTAGQPVCKPTSTHCHVSMASNIKHDKFCQKLK